MKLFTSLLFNFTGWLILVHQVSRAQPSPTPTLSSGPLPTTATGVKSLIDSVFHGCPPPLVPNTLRLETHNCHGACCLGCPASSLFYAPGQMDTLHIATSSIRAISCLSMVVLAVSYLVLPGRRQHPHVIVLFKFITIAIWEGMGVPWLVYRRSLICHSSVQDATMSDTPLCGFQGIALVYLVAVLFIQGITLVANLHCLAVYDSLRVQRHISTCIAMSFVLPVVLIIPPALRGQFGFSGYGSICFMSAKWVNTYFFYPVGAMMIVSVMVHLSTVIFMIKMYFTRKQQRLASSDTVATLGDSESHHERGGTARDITRMLKQQWRPGAFAMCQLLAYMIYFLFYFVEIKKFGHINSSVEWFQQWIACFYQQAIDNIQQLAISTPSATVADLTSDATVSSLGDAAQQTCLAITSPHVPVFWKLVFSDMAPAVFGLCIFLIFGSKAELWQDWHEYLFERSAKMPWDEQKPHRVIGTVTSASNNPPDAQEKRHSSQDGGTTKGHGLGREPKHSRSIPLASPGEKKADDASQLYKHRNSTEDELEDMTVLDAYTHGRNLS